MAHKPRLDLDQIQQRNISRIYSFRFGFLIFSTNQNAQNERSFILRFLYMIGYMDGWISDQTDTVLYGWMSTSSKVNKIEIIFLNIAEINFIFNEPKWKWASWKPFKVWIEFNDSKRREVGKDFLSSNNIHDATATTTQTLNTIFKSGPFPASFLFIFVFSIQLIINKCSIKFCRWLESNRGPLVLKATTLPTEPQPLPILVKSRFTPKRFFITWLLIV